MAQSTSIIQGRNTPISQSSSGETWPDRLSHSLPTPRFFHSRSSSSSSLDSVDIQGFQLSLVNTGSLFSGTLINEGGSGDLCYSQRRPIAWPQPLNSAVEAPAYGTFIEEEVQRDEFEGPKELEDTRFIGISAGRFWVVFTTVALGYFVACFDSTLMASSHPVITSYFGASQTASWLSTAFLITSTSFQPLFGRLSDTVGRKSVLLLSLAIFGLTMLWCALAETIESFIAARAVCGLGAGGTMSMSLIIVSDLVPIEHRGVFQSHINLAFGLGSSSGAALGGWLCDNFGWRWAFGVQIPLIGLCFIIAMFCTPSNLGPMLINAEKGGAWVALQNFDTFGSLLLVTTFTSLILILNCGGNIFSWSSPVIILCGITSILGSLGFIRVELQAKQPLMPLRLLSKPPIANMVFANLLGGIASNTVLFNLPLFFQAVLLKFASNSGLLLALPSLMGSFAGISTGYIITYTRRLKPTLMLGAWVYLVGSIAVSAISPKTSEFLCLILITIVPLGQGFVFPNTMMSALAVSDQEHQAVVTTTVGLWRNLGFILGIALSSLVFQNRLNANLGKYVTGSERNKVIDMVRSSVKSIRLLEHPIQQQVITAYALSLRTTFWCAIAASIAMITLIIPVRLPRLRQVRAIVVSTGE